MPPVHEGLMVMGGSTPYEYENHRGNPAVAARWLSSAQSPAAAAVHPPASALAPASIPVPRERHPAPLDRHAAPLHLQAVAGSDDSPQDHEHHHAATSLFIESDNTFLDPVHNFLRSSCIEVFAATQNDVSEPGRGARPGMVGQAGLRCSYCKDMSRQDLARQAVCYPTRRDNIFESVRNYQRTHFDACPRIPSEAKERYRMLLREDTPRRKTHKVLKAYYAEAAGELGLVDVRGGMAFGAPPNASGTPSSKLRAIIDAAHSASKFPAHSSKGSAKIPKMDTNEAMSLRKFEDVASEETRYVLFGARREPTALVRPQDYDTISDADFLIFHQLKPFRPTPDRLEQKGLDAGRHVGLSGLCCRHCARAYGGDIIGHRGVYIPTDCASLTDSSFAQTLLNHVMSCSNVPPEIKRALDELKQLAIEYGVVAKRGSKKRFFKKIWERLKEHQVESS